MDKAQINAVVKQIKKIRSESGRDKEEKKDGKDKKFSVQVSSKPEKVMIGLGLAAGMAILFDDSKKRRKHPEKARPFYRRCYDNYKKLDGLLDSTVAHDLKKRSERQFKDDVLENMEIEKALKFDL